ncbi:hypothetical protein, partial [Pseudomonas aeruginosa]|uniref:hypothetical protein n=1 Tax=Pseudomonas aeruginosa TaxID=287 RepID=UPI001E63857A
LLQPPSQYLHWLRSRAFRTMPKGPRSVPLRAATRYRKTLQMRDAQASMPISRQVIRRTPSKKHKSLFYKDFFDANDKKMKSARSQELGIRCSSGGGMQRYS